VTQC